MRVLQVIWDDDFGGAERHVLDLVTNLHPPVFQCEVAILHTDSDRISRDIKKRAVPIHRLRFRSGFDVLGAVRFIRFLRRERFDIVHTHIGPLWIQLAVSLFTRSVNIATEHSAQWKADPKLRSVVMKRISRFFTDFYIVPSFFRKETIMRLYGIPGRQIQAVHHGIDFSRFTPSTEEARRNRRRELGLADSDFAIGTVGRLTDQKNYPCFVRSAVRIHEEMPNARFHIIGFGPLEASLQNMIRELDARAYITILGRRRDVASIMGAWDVFLFPTWRESFGIVVAEAMAMELPVVVSNTTSLPEVVGETGILVQTDDDREFASSVIALLRDEERRTVIGKRARERVLKMFSIEKMIEETAETYQKLANAARRSGPG